MEIPGIHFLLSALLAGLIAEYDTPGKLLENESSLFAKLVAEYSMRSNSSFENASDT